MRVAIALIPWSAWVIPIPVIHCSQVSPLIGSSGSSLGRRWADKEKNHSHRLNEWILPYLLCSPTWLVYVWMNVVRVSAGGIVLLGCFLRELAFFCFYSISLADKAMEEVAGLPSGLVFRPENRCIGMAIVSTCRSWNFFSGCSILMDRKLDPSTDAYGPEITKGEQNRLGY